MPLGDQAFQYFDVGRQIAGESGLSGFLKDMTERVNAMDLLRAKASYDLQGNVAKEQALSPFRIQEAGQIAREKAKAELEYDPFFGTHGLANQDISGGQVPPSSGIQYKQQDLNSKIASIQKQLPPGSSYTRGGLRVESAERQPAPLRPPPSVQLDAYRGIEESIRRLEELKQSQQKFHFGTGPLSARFYRNQFGNLVLQARGTPDESQFMKRSNQFQDIYRRAVTGAQAGFPEIRFLSSSIPNPGAENPENYLKSVDTTLEELYANRDLMRHILKSSGYKVPEMSGMTPPFAYGQLRGGMIRVRDKATGKPGSIPQEDFDPNEFDLING